VKKQFVASCGIVAQFILTAEASAETPCDVLRAEYQALATQHPEMTEDTGDGKFMMAVLGPKLDSRSRSIDCAGFRAWLKEASLDTATVADLEQDDLLCYMSLDLYDHREDGNFVALAGSQGSAHCPVVQVLNLDKGRVRAGWSGNGDCAPASFNIVRIANRAYPMALSPKVYGNNLSYRIDLISVDPNVDGPYCSVSITYQPEFPVGHWFGPKGENDVDPELRWAVGPIVSALAGGKDASELIKPWLDRPRGDSPYDNAIRSYPDRPIDGLRFPNTGEHVYDLPGVLAFLAGESDNFYYENAYGTVAGEDAIPLIIAGRRLLLTFGYAAATGRPPPEAAFGVWEYNDQKRDFDAVAGGLMERRGRNPRIE
jgi:hypothetical protein